MCISTVSLLLLAGFCGTASPRIINNNNGNGDGNIVNNNSIEGGSGNIINNNIGENDGGNIVNNNNIGNGGNITNNNGGIGGSVAVASQTSSDLQASASASPPLAVFSTPRNRLSAGAAAGIAVAVTFLIFVLFAVCILRRYRLQRRRAGRERAVGPEPHTISPFTLVESQSVATKESLTDPEGYAPSRTAHRLFGLIPLRGIRTMGSGSSRTASATITEASDVEAQLQAAREQLNILQNRIHALEGDRNSTERTREPPPEYRRGLDVIQELV
ncbi:hypothetical protein MVEN_01703200 [Mycena venus]|uniref:Uncharacterized protein n=1 Tax=Mycena venus TaxID=2733690 RepID=A0A8H6XN70_9AGAR|nr:hypothetical protein MVEN_01703200 [Mycena venus]